MVFPAEVCTVPVAFSCFPKRICRQRGCSLYFVLQCMELWDQSAQNQVVSGLFIHTELASCTCLLKACLNPLH